ncbi:MAG: peptide ABC transporter permease [Deltaproteobacteria bacterium]|nr:peptide ABC transporter permease [Deltaproteobacteria bacterium]HCH64841.1 ABC transporter permease [Deltaproteobacteria bacterium]
MRGWGSVDAWLEVVSALIAKPLRTGLTAFSVAWGVFMLILLLAAGDGLEGSMRWNFRDDAINSIWVSAGKTSRPHEGRPIGRRLQLTNRDVTLAEALPESDHVTARFAPPDDTSVAYQGRVATFDIRSTHPGHRHIEGTTVAAGRFLNHRDIDDRRKVTVIGRRVAEFFFPGQSDLTAPIGKILEIGGVAFTVVGVFTDDGGEREEQVIYLPVSTAQGSFGGLDHVQRVMFTVGPPDIDAASLDDADRAVASIRSSIAAHHGFHPDDRTALRVRDRIHSYADVQAVFTWLQRFTWVVGIGTVLAAMVGVGNTLLISVKERTRELGLRKALGARRADIIGMVLREAFLLTATAGWAGLLAGIALVEGARRWMPENDYLRDPNVDLESVGWSVLALVATGVVAGLVPAWQAAMVPPVVALQDE